MSNTSSPTTNGDANYSRTDSINQSINPLEMVAAAAQEQQQNGSLSLYEVLLIGSYVECIVGGCVYQGFVADLDENWLYLEIVTRCERQLRMFNLKFLQQARTILPPNENYAIPEDEIDMSVAADRLRQKLTEVQEKTVKDVSLEGIETFVYMKKMFENVSWKNKSVLVLDLVLINPPYTPNDCVLHSTDPRAEVAHNQVRKVMGAIPALIEERKRIMSDRGLSLSGPPLPITDEDEEEVLS